MTGLIEYDSPPKWTTSTIRPAFQQGVPSEFGGPQAEIRLRDVLDLVGFGGAVSALAAPQRPREGPGRLSSDFGTNNTVKARFWR